MKKTVIASIIALVLATAGLFQLRGSRAPQPATPTPTPPINVVIVSSDAFAPSPKSGYFYVVGEVRNDSSATVGSVKINAVLRDGSGKVIARDYDLTNMETLLPGMTAPFRVHFGEPSEWAAYKTHDATVQARTMEAPIPKEGSRGEHILEAPALLDILSPRASSTGTEFRVQGKVRNQHAQRRRSIEVFLTLYDSKGQVVDWEGEFANPMEMRPGQEGTFDVAVSDRRHKTDRRKIARYTIQAYSDSAVE